MNASTFKSLFLGLFALPMLIACDNELEHLSPSNEGKFSPKAEVQLASLLKADEISFDLVEQIALPKNAHRLRGLSGKGVSSKYTISEDGKVLMYVFNYKPSGYMIISATRNYTPIVAYSDTGEIDLENMPDNLTYIIEGYKQDIRRSASLPDSVKRKYAAEWESLNLKKITLRSLASQSFIDEQLQRLQSEGYTIYSYDDLKSGFNPYLNQEELHRLFANPAGFLSIFNPSVFMIVKRETEEKVVKPLLRTSWGQDVSRGSSVGYNKYSPLYDSFNPELAPIGCVAVAVGQIMHYHKFPHSYQWSEMPNTYATDVTAKFLYDVALGVKMNFGYLESTSSYVEAAEYLRSLSYDVDVCSFDANEIIGEMNAKRPVYLRGSKKGQSGGHAFVVDGYDITHSHERVQVIDINENYAYDATPEYYQVLYEKVTTPHSSFRLHLNLGWEGKSDGYYASSVLAGYNSQNLMLTIRKK